MIKYFAISTFLVLFLFTSSLAESSTYEIKFGILERTSSGYNVAVETTNIPFYVENSGFKFGFTIKSNNNAPFSGYQVTYLPHKPEMLEGYFEEQQLNEDGNVFKGPIQSQNGSTWGMFWLNAGDPLGEYKIEIFINGKLEKRILFSVFHPTN